MNIPHRFIHWVLAYLANRTLLVCFYKNRCSDVNATNTGAPQDTVLAPFIFTLYTADCRTQDVNYPLIKIADDTAMIVPNHDNDDMKYQFHLKSFVDYCNTNYLQLNISKKKQLFIDFLRTASPPHSVLINGAEVERVSSYKYLGFLLNDCLSWSDKVDAMIKKLNSMLCCIRRMAKFNARTDIINIFYNSTINVGVLRYCLVACFKNRR